MQPTRIVTGHDAEGRADLTVPIVPGDDGARATFPIVVQA